MRRKIINFSVCTWVARTFSMRPFCIWRGTQWTKSLKAYIIFGFELSILISYIRFPLGDWWIKVFIVNTLDCFFLNISMSGNNFTFITIFQILFNQFLTVNIYSIIGQIESLIWSIWFT
jgi:hypothetical protein